MKIKFKDFIKSNESGRFLVNPFWLEYLLNLFFQGYFGEFWEEIQDTKIEQNKTIENVGYGVIANCMKGGKDDSRMPKT